MSLHIDTTDGVKVTERGVPIDAARVAVHDRTDAQGTHRVVVVDGRERMSWLLEPSAAQNAEFMRARAERASAVAREALDRRIAARQRLDAARALLVAEPGNVALAARVEELAREESERIARG